MGNPLGTLQVSNRRRPLLALTYQRTAGGEDFLGYMTRGVPQWCPEIREARGSGLLGERRAAFARERGPWEMVSCPPGTVSDLEAGRLDAELGSLGIVCVSVWVVHGWALQDSITSGRGVAK